MRVLKIKTKREKEIKTKKNARTRGRGLIDFTRRVETLKPHVRLIGGFIIVMS